MTIGLIQDYCMWYIYYASLVNLLTVDMYSQFKRSGKLYSGFEYIQLLNAVFASRCSCTVVL